MTLEIELELLTLEDLLNVLMIQNGQEKFLKFQEIHSSNQPIYKLVDWYEKPVAGTFYQNELQKIETTDTDMWKIEKVLKYKGRGNKREALVHWLGWPKHFDSWIPASEIKKK